MIAIIDYGLGNVQAFANVYKRLNIPAVIAKDPATLAMADKLILPGVGAFDHAMKLFDASGLRQAVEILVHKNRLPVLGICVGMQILASSSEEGVRSGLGWIDGKVKKLDVSTLSHQTRLPHMGWNDVNPVVSNKLFGNLETDARFYFLHSFYFECASRQAILAESEYGMKFSCAVHSDNIYGVQFHPEKSHHFGVQLLKNFAAL